MASTSSEVSLRSRELALLTVPKKSRLAWLCPRALFPSFKKFPTDKAVKKLFDTKVILAVMLPPLLGRK